MNDMAAALTLASMQAHLAAMEQRALAAEMERDELKRERRVLRETIRVGTEQLAAAEAEAKNRGEALRGCLAYLWPSPDEGHTGFVDRLGVEFYRETGVWPHFKSAPMDMHTGDMEESRKRWSAWLEAKRDAAANAARAALKEPR